jgi:adenine C2-methylase RlmN of 23S rRNA A2503 and tRNA A37
MKAKGIAYCVRLKEYRLLKEKDFESSEKERIVTFTLPMKDRAITFIRKKYRAALQAFNSTII